MIDVQRFVRDVCDCVGIPYITPGGTGKDCSKTGIDCSGLIVRAYKLQGVTLPVGSHSSNYFARNELFGKPEQLIRASQLEVGLAVFKWREWRDGVSPKRYKKDGLGDFHHIGVVTSVQPLTITHASSVYEKVVQ